MVYELAEKKASSVVAVRVSYSVVKLAFCLANSWVGKREYLSAIIEAVVSVVMKGTSVVANLVLVLVFLLDSSMDTYSVGRMAYR
jgi:hypothetical protein